MSENYPDPSDFASFYEDSALCWGEDDTCEFCDGDLEEGAKTTELHCRRCEAEFFYPEE